MGKFPVIATAVGYYGGILRGPEDKFAIDKIGDFSKAWMIPNGWAFGKDGAPKKLPKVAKDALKEIEAPVQEDAEDTQALTWRGAKSEYGGEDSKVTLQEALDTAVDDFGLGIKDWNKLNEKERSKRVMAVVGDMVNAKQAEIAAVDLTPDEDTAT